MVLILPTHKDAASNLGRFILPLAMPIAINTIQTIAQPMLYAV
jgi:hypothetical protein